MENYLFRRARLQDAQRQGVAKRLFAAVERLATTHGIGCFRVDTNFDNDRMLRLLENCGFEYCGEIIYNSGSRMAFEKLI